MLVVNQCNVYYCKVSNYSLHLSNELLRLRTYQTLQIRSNVYYNYDNRKKEYTYL